MMRNSPPQVFPNEKTGIFTVEEEPSGSSTYRRNEPHFDHEHDSNEDSSQCLLCMVRQLKGSASVNQLHKTHQFRPKSIAIYYEVKLREALAAVHSDTPDDQPDAVRTAVCMTLLADMMWALAPYDTALSIILDEIDKAVYSESLTTGTVGMRSKHSPELIRVPWFDRVIEAERARAQLDIQLQIEEKRASKAEFRTQIIERDWKSQLHDVNEEHEEIKAENVRLNREVKLLKMELDKVKREKEEHMEASAQAISFLEQRNNKLSTEIYVLQETINELSGFRTTVEHLKQGALHVNHMQSIGTPMRDESDVAARLGTVMQKLKAQTLSDYEIRLDGGGKESQLVKDQNEVKLRHEFEQQYRELSSEDSSLFELSERLLHEDEEYRQRCRHMFVSNRNAVCVASSVDGIKYTPVRDKLATECKQCGAYVHLCRHNATMHSIRVKLPQFTQFVEVSHPQMDPMFLSTQYAQLHRKRNLKQGDYEVVGGSIKVDMFSRIPLLPKCTTTWKQWRRRCDTSGYRVGKPRIMQIHRLLKVIEQVYQLRAEAEGLVDRKAADMEQRQPGSVLRLLGGNTAGEIQRFLPVTLQDCFFEYLERRYNNIEDVVLQTAYELLLSIEICQSKAVEVELFTKCMENKVDASAPKYIKLILRAKQLLQIDTSSMESVGAMIRTIYPYHKLEQDQCETLFRSYVGDKTIGISDIEFERFFYRQLVDQNETRYRKMMKLIHEMQQSTHSPHLSRNQMIHIAQNNIVNCDLDHLYWRYYDITMSAASVAAASVAAAMVTGGLHEDSEETGGGGGGSSSSRRASLVDTEPRKRKEELEEAMINSNVAYMLAYHGLHNMLVNRFGELD